MTAGDVETYYECGRWKNRSNGMKRLSSSHATKEEAVLVGLEIARYRGAEHIIKSEDGTIEQRHSYRSDP